MVSGVALGITAAMSTTLRVIDNSREAEGLICVNTVSSKRATLGSRSGPRLLVGSCFHHGATVYKREAQQRHYFSMTHVSILRPNYYAAVKEGLKEHESRNAWADSSRKIWKGFAVPAHPFRKDVLAE